MRFNAGHRKDGNHDEIRDEFLRHGCSWMDTYQLGDGRPDAVVGLGGLAICIEIKDSNKPPSKQKLTPDEERFHKTWTGGMKIVKDKADVYQTVLLLNQWHGTLTDPLVGLL